MFASPAFAQAADAGAGGAFATFIPLILIFVIMYFLMIRPQQKKAKLHKQMVESLRRGDQVLTQGGIIGKVNRVHEDGTVEVQISDDVRVKILRQTIARVLNKTEVVE